MIFRNVRAILPGVAAVILLAGCGGSSGSPAAAHSPNTGRAASTKNTIVIQSFAFHPTSLTVSPGATVTVRNADSTTHTLTDKADPKLFNTGDIAPGKTETFTAPTKAGSYPYICLIHQFMAGTLIVS